MDQKEKTDIRSLNLKELTVFMEQLGEKAFRAKQIYQWLHGKQAASFEEMTNIPKALIEKLKENSHLVSIKQEAVQISKIDGTRKYLFLLDDGNVIESVFMRYKHGNSVCISSPGGMPHGMPILRIYIGRSCERTDPIRDVRPDLPDWKRHRRAGFQCGRDGNRGSQWIISITC